MKLHRFFLSFACVLLLLMLGAALLPQPVFAAPYISIYPKSGAPGTRVVIDGTNFTSYIGDRLSIFFSDIEIPKIAISVPLSGNFQVAFEVPTNVQPGDSRVSIRNEAGRVLAEEFFAVPMPEVRLSTWAGTVATNLQVNVRGFYVGKSVVFNYYYRDETMYLGTQVAGETGECSIQFTVPASPRGKHSIVASNDEGQRAVAEFGIIPSVTIEPQVAAVGDIVIVSGNGFTAESNISVNLYDTSVASAKTDDLGTFYTRFNIPVIKAGKYLVGVEDVSREVRWGDLLITSRISLSKSTGEVGAKLTLSGTGFEVRSNIIINFNAQESFTARTDDIGAFSCTFDVPICIAGDHIITATDGTNLRQVVYTVESDEPTAPQPLLPKQNDIVTMPLTFNWEAVYDISQPLFYTFQVARTSDFVHPILEKSGFTFSRYELEDVGILLPNRKGTHYYWRVRAIDGASNIGEWSTPIAFRVKPVDILPNWARYVLIVVQIAVTVLFTYGIWKAIKNDKSTI
jgi:hypothetical protein